MRLTILMPVRDDWESAARLCSELDRLSMPGVSELRVLLVDDGSSVGPGNFLSGQTLNHIHAVDVLELRRNLGHQRAICVGLAYAHQNIAFDAVVVMDADGEDRPEDVPRLVVAFEKNDRRALVFAERGRRVEGAVFRSGYAFYRLLHYLLTGRKIRVGNFSLIPRSLVDRLMAVPEMWSHYAAAVLNSRIPTVTIRTDRGQRYSGQSRMDFVSLVMHGLAAITVYQNLAVRLLLSSAVACLILVVLAVALLIGGFRTGPASWNGSAVVGVLAVLLLAQFFNSALSFALLTVGFRTRVEFIPIRDYAYFVLRCTRVYPA